MAGSGHGLYSRSMNLTTPVLVGLSVLLSTASAPAAVPLGQDGQVTVGVERLFGLSRAWRAASDDGVTRVALFGATGFEGSVAPFSTPRLGVDAFVGGGVSVGLGGSFGVLSINSDSVRIFGLSPRFGYAIPLGRSATFWPRVGLSYLNFSGDGESRYLLAATLEAQIVAPIGPQVAFTFSPTLDYGVAGSSSTKPRQAGVEVGLLAWF